MMKSLGFFIFLGAILSAIGGLWATYKQDSEKASTTGEKLGLRKWLARHPATLGLLGALLCAVGSLWTVFKQENEKATEKTLSAVKEAQAATEKAMFERELRNQADKQTEAQIKLREKSEEIAESQALLRSRSDEIARLNKEIAEGQRALRIKSDEIASLNKETIQAITGGESFCYVRTDELLEPTPNLNVEHVGKYALSDVYIKLLDEESADELLKSGKSMGDTLGQSSIHKYLGNITPLQKLFFGKAPRANSQTHRYSIYVYAKNGVWHQWLRMKRVNGIWRTATRVTGSNSARIVFEFIDIDYPRNNKGEVEW